MSAPTLIHKQTPDDFRVEELPAHAPTGEGQHLWLWIEKRGLSTGAAVGRLARLLDVPRRRIRSAGMKDARAVTRQWLSVDRPPVDAAERLERLDGDGEAWVRALEVVPSRRGLSKGQLFGNRFHVRLRAADGDLPAGLADELGERVRGLAESGVPNRFGAQRFGHRGDTARVGEALLRGRHAEATELMLGRPSELDHGRILEAREAFARGDLAAARDAWPRDQDGPRRLLGALIAGACPADAWAKVDRRHVELFGNAWQAELFNALVDLRTAELGDLVQLLPGDLALRLPLGRKAFEVEDLATEQARARAGELTASGPLFGPDMPWPNGAAGELEDAVLIRAGWTRDQLAALPPRPWPGGRRGLRMGLALAPASGPPAAAGTDERGGFVELCFELPKGGYATTVLAELDVA